jgi:hypothetical protein
MNYILFFYGEIPNYLEYSLNSILSSDKNAEIYLCTNKKFDRKNITNICFDDFKDLKEKKVEIDSILSNTPLETNPLWSTSLMRIYVLKKLVEEFNKEEFIHFDTDVIVYKSFEDIKKNYDLDKSKLNITLLDSENIFKNYDLYKNKYSNGLVFNEMKMLKIIKIEYPEIFSLLPSTPYKNHSILFDPAGYGQFLDGSHLNRGNYYFKRRYISLTSEVGRELKSKRIKLEFKKNTPNVVYNSMKFELCNLHIHSKRLHKFLPKNYKSII